MGKDWARARQRAACRVSPSGAGEGASSTYSVASRPGDRGSRPPAAALHTTTAQDLRQRAATPAVDREVTLESHLSVPARVPRGLSPPHQTHSAHSVNRFHGRGGTHGTPPAPGAYVTRNSYSSPLFLPVTTQRTLPCLSGLSDKPLPFLQPPNIRKASPRRKPTMVRSREVRTTGAARRRCPSSADSPGCALLCS